MYIYRYFLSCCSTVFWGFGFIQVWSSSMDMEMDVPEGKKGCSQFPGNRKHITARVWKHLGQSRGRDILGKHGEKWGQVF